MRRIEFVKMKTKFTIKLIILTILTIFFIACSNDSEIKTTDYCKDVDCKMGTCIIENNRAKCDCNDGYHEINLECVKDEVDLCENVNCSNNGTCAVQGDKAVCVCNEGYYSKDLECLENTNPCDGITCSDHGECFADSNSQAYCECETSYRVDGTNCILTIYNTDDIMKYFVETYEEGRLKFRQLADKVKSQNDDAYYNFFEVPSQVDTDLTVDYLYIPAKIQKEKLLIITTGVHGMEGYLGSAALQHFLYENLKNLNLDNMGVLVFNSINPYGMKYYRRVSENNVDMNRSFDITDDLFSTENELYGEINEFLNPTVPVDIDSWDNELTYLQLAQYITSVDELKEAVLGGQYEYPKGVYFGGSQFEPQKQEIENLLLQYTADYSTLFLFDIHTAYGDRGKLHLLMNAGLSDTQKTALNSIFEGYVIEDTGENASDPNFRLSGDITVYFEDLFADKKVITMTLEYGTLNTLDYTGAIDALDRTRLENQGFHYGYASEADKIQVEEEFREMFYPSSESYRRDVMNQTITMFDLIFKRFENLDW
jgi:hypothetical protein